MAALRDERSATVTAVADFTQPSTFSYKRGAVVALQHHILLHNAHRAVL
jgi:hypothetical protein